MIAPHDRVLILVSGFIGLVLAGHAVIWLFPAG